MTPERALINKALWAFRPTTEQGKAVSDLALLCERLLAGGYRAPSDEVAIRKEIDDGPTLALLAWADLLEERGEEPAVCSALRTLARQGKRPGMAGGLYRWTSERPEFGAGASWTLPEDVVRTLTLRSLDLGGKERGRFASQSAALLAAARVTAAQQKARAPSLCVCRDPCRCVGPVCCNCGLTKPSAGEGEV